MECNGVNMAPEIMKREDSSDTNFNVYVGSETGFLKGN